MTITTEVERRVFDDEQGACIAIGPDHDGFGLVFVRTPNASDAEWFGKVEFTMDPEFARSFAAAVLAAADDAESMGKANKMLAK